MRRGQQVAPRNRLGLTRREAEVIRLHVDGASHAEIGKRLNIAQGTVRAHLSKVFETWGVSGRAQAISFLHDKLKLPPLSTYIEVPNDM